jgi:hypothetical protein
MGLGYHFVEGLVREHKYRPLSGDVLLIGRQTIYFTPQTILKLLREHNVEVDDITESEIDLGGSTINRMPGYPADLITDEALFKLLGIPKIIGLDHSSYEGAEIIHDLNQPIPPHLRECADVIVDGSTLDNVFDPAAAIRNFSSLLRPGGRLITSNMYSNHYEPYAILPPLWYHDYFVVNGFSDCKVYIMVQPFEMESDVTAEGKLASDIFTIDIDALLDPNREVRAFYSTRIMGIIVFAEKSANSTSHINPTQQHYRSDEEWIRYRENLAQIKNSQRPHLVRSLGKISYFYVRAGHLFMAEDFTARDPGTEIRALNPLPASAL